MENKMTRRSLSNRSDNNPKRKYEPPRLTRYGTLKNLTRGDGAGFLGEKGSKADEGFNS